MEGSSRRHLQSHSAMSDSAFEMKVTNQRPDVFSQPLADPVEDMGPPGSGRIPRDSSEKPPALNVRKPASSFKKL